MRQSHQAFKSSTNAGQRVTTVARCSEMLCGPTTNARLLQSGTQQTEQKVGKSSRMTREFQDHCTCISVLRRLRVSDTVCWLIPDLKVYACIHSKLGWQRSMAVLPADSVFLINCVNSGTPYAVLLSFVCQFMIISPKSSKASQWIVPVDRSSASS
jgi:hypothetical protein